MKDNIKNQQGSILIYAVFTMLALGSITMLMSFVLLISIRSTANSTKAISAYYAAESGLEMSLHTVQDYRDSKIYDLTDTIAAIDASSPVNLTESDSEYEVIVTQEIDEVVFNLPFPNTKQIDLYDPDDGTPIITSSSILYLDWEPGDDCGSDYSIEISYKGFDSSNWQSSIEDENYISTTIGCYAPSTACTDSSILLTGNYGYRIKLRPLYCSLDNMTVKIGNSPTYVTFENYLTFTSIGQTGKSSTALRADTLWKPPLSGLGEFVLFSEEDVIK